MTSRSYGNGFKVTIAGAGAHLSVIGVPRSLNNLDGLDSLLSRSCRCPKGVPIATVAIDGARNAGLLAARTLANGDSDLRKTMQTKFPAQFAAPMNDLTATISSRRQSQPNVVARPIPDSSRADSPLAPS